MARSIKAGIAYFSMDVDFFSDRKIRRLISACGAASVAVVMKIWCSVYDEKGYYIEAGDDLFFDVADELGVEETYVRAVVDKALKTGLFHAPLFSRCGILTSARIQRNYMDATRKRVVNNTLSDEYALVAPRASGAETSVSGTESGVSGAESGVSGAGGTQSKEKKRKEEKSKEEQGAASATGEALIPFGEKVRMTRAEYGQLEGFYGEEGAARMAEILDHYKCASGKTYQSDYRAILSWVVRRWREETRRGGTPVRARQTAVLADDFDIDL